MAGKPKTTVNLERLRSMYLDHDHTMPEVASAFGYSLRQITGIIQAQRDIDPASWPKRYPKPKEAKKPGKKWVNVSWKK